MTGLDSTTYTDGTGTPGAGAPGTATPAGRPVGEAPADGVHGSVAPGYEAVREVFATNLREVEAGAAFAVHRYGECVVDLWGGVADDRSGTPWTRDTRAQIFSGSKGVVVTTLLRLCDEGVLDLDRPVAHYWPEFAAHGKSEVTVSDVATYTGGLPAVTSRVVDHRLLGDARAMAAVLAAQKPVPAPRLVYGPYTMGWILDELAVRTTGLTLRDVFRTQIAEPHGLAVDWAPWSPGQIARVTYDDAFTSQYDRFNTSEDALVRAIWANPIPFPQGAVVWNSPGLADTYVPAANIAGTARDIARMYGLVAEDLRRPDGERGNIARAATVREAITLSVRQDDPTLGFPFAYGRGGYRLKGVPRDGVDGDMFGHDGGGGSAHFAWPGSGISLSYTPNRLLDIGNNDHRAGSLIRALKQSLHELESTSAS
ncbi:serine hydrolase domain-containing protein [Streptomyces sp. FH025]|uniref:serine hydrolase domain-containing protein n=1 Tax=Streptomyces sp. FH025 TaxID=2815937 RepID=UPI001A9DABAA|nr:serine hydrolase domain-containing protein [Streptomyces sp. FH025]MBO1416094.1 beta-lactamase family protein [Streptomyces sp. FH025]